VDHESPELIEAQMNETKQSLTEKVAALENQVVGTIQSATSAVQETVDSVQSVIHDTVESVKDTVEGVKDTVEGSVTSMQEGVMHAFDVTDRVREHPWPLLGGAAAAGFVTGLLVFRKSEPSAPPVPHGYMPFVSAPPTARAAAPEGPPETPRKPGWLDELFDMAGREVRQLGERALNQALAAVKQNIDQGLPALINNVLHVSDKTAEPARANGASYPRTV